MSDTNASSGVSAERLKFLIQRIERVETDRAGLSEDLKQIYIEAKSAGFDTKIIRKIISLRKIEIEKRREESELLALYAAALGMEE